MTPVSNLLGTLYVAGTDSDSKDTAVSKVNKNPCPLGTSSSVMEADADEIKGGDGVQREKYSRCGMGGGYRFLLFLRFY